MCGLVGFCDPDMKSWGAHPEGMINAMLTRVNHRGPDSSGVVISRELSVALGHKRLAIQDLTSAGAQPMASKSGRYTIAFNGEIYNHLEIRKRYFHSHSWFSNSDTETLLTAIEQLGLDFALRVSKGMFAFALIDKVSATVTLCRDRFGEKPLYYVHDRVGGIARLYFASELGALRVCSTLNLDLDPISVDEFLRYGCIGGSSTIYRGVKKLLPGSVLKFDLGSGHLETEVWHDSLRSFEDQRRAEKVWQTAEVKRDAKRVLRSAVDRQMISDVPLGAFLSGGVDSSVIVALMQEQSMSKIKTFSIGFSEHGYNEAPYAAAVARHLGTEHHEMYVSAKQAMDVIVSLPEIFSEPFADSSQIPTYLVSKFARESVTVSLSGDAGDELFGGYSRYLHTNSLWTLLSILPPAARKRLKVLFSTLDEKLISKWMPTAIEPRYHKLVKGASLIDAINAEDLYARMLCSWQGQDTFTQSQCRGGMLKGLVSDPYVSSQPLVERMMMSDFLGYLVDDILVKVDRAAMAVSLETRVPFLDPDVVAFANSLPLQYKVRGGETKWALRQVLDDYIPRQLIERPKTGFGIPLGSWLRTDLADWADHLLSPTSLEKSGLLQTDGIIQMWHQHRSGSMNHQYRLWNVLMFQAWLHASE